MLKAARVLCHGAVPGQRDGIERSGKRSGLESPAKALREDETPRGGVGAGLRRGAREGAGGGSRAQDARAPPGRVARAVKPPRGKTGSGRVPWSPPAEDTADPGNAAGTRARARARRRSAVQPGVRTKSTRAARDRTKAEPRPPGGERRLTGISGQEDGSADGRTCKTLGSLGNAKDTDERTVGFAQVRELRGGEGAGDAEAGRERRAPQPPGDHGAAGQGCGAHRQAASPRGRTRGGDCGPRGAVHLDDESHTRSD